MKKFLCNIILFSACCVAYTQSNNIFNGGNGDGYAAVYLNNGNIFNGGPGDGYTTTTVSINLPVHFVYFKASQQGKRIILQWRTSFEQSADRFEIEKSEDGMVFKKIGESKAKGDAVLGNTYSFADEQPSKGYNYYRLKQIDKDANFVFTPTIAVNIKEERTSEIAIYPQPAKSNITLELPEELNNQNVVINFINTAGFVEKQVKVNSNRASSKLIISVVGFSPGVHLVHVKSGKGDYLSKLLVQ